MTKTSRPARRSAKPDAPKFDPYAAITEQVVAMLEAGTAPWHKPWNAGTGMPRSLSSGKPYRGVNPFLLAMAAAERGYASPWWGTYNQLAERGGQVREDEKGTLVAFWKTYETEDKTTGEKTRRFVLRTFKVFNLEQADPAEEGGTIRLPRIDAELRADRHDHDRIAACDAAIAAYYAADGAPSFGTGGDAAYYSPGRDHVQLPELSTFESPEAYHGAVFHESVHSTGHASRLNREGIVEGHTFGDALYAREELVAEMGAAFLAGMTGIAAVTLPTSAAYLASWIRVLKGDPKLVVQAAGAAQKAAELILGVTHGDAPAGREEELAGASA